MPPQEPVYSPSGLIERECSSESLDLMRSDYIQGTNKKSNNTEYTREQLLSYVKCFSSNIAKQDSPSTWMKLFDILCSAPSILIRYGILFPLRFITLGASTAAFFTALPVAVTLDSDRLVSLSVNCYCKAILLSLGVKVNYKGEKPRLNSPHVFVASGIEEIAHQFPHAVVMARHTGALGFLQKNGLNYLHSLTFDRSNMTERRDLSQSLKRHVKEPENKKNPMVIFPEGTCVNNKYAIRFQKGAFELGVNICPVGIKMTRWITTVDVNYCEPQSPGKDSAVEYGDRVKKIIACSAGLEQVDFNGTAKRELLNVWESS